MNKSIIYCVISVIVVAYISGWLVDQSSKIIFDQFSKSKKFLPVLLKVIAQLLYNNYVTSFIQKYIYQMTQQYAIGMNLTIVNILFSLMNMYSQYNLKKNVSFLQSNLR